MKMVCVYEPSTDVRRHKPRTSYSLICSARGDLSEMVNDDV
jgi:hypothetical protein